MKTLPADFQNKSLPPVPTLDEVRQVAPDCEFILHQVLITLLDRFEQRPDYPFIDTKLDLLSGDDFPEDDPLRGLGTIYGWIQGRGLESLAGHARWLQNTYPDDYEETGPRIEAMMKTVLASLQKMREKNGGHLFFFMKPEGSPFTLSENGEKSDHPLDGNSPYNFSDQFCAKGMLAAARFLGDESAAKEALDYCLAVERSVAEGNFLTDQQSLDPKLAVQPVAGKTQQGTYMILLSAAAIRAESPDDKSAVKSGMNAIRRVLKLHSNSDGDFWEAIDDQGRPYREESGAILSDPGHALEFVGLALKFIQTALQRKDLSPEIRDELKTMAGKMPPILEKNFANGFQPAPGGIGKAYDIEVGKLINDDMPWWSLPETMRAALACHQVADEDDKTTRQKSLNIFAACHNAFFTHYLLPDIHYMAVQTRTATGEISPAIPATTDADPGYHTGLSLIDCLELIK